MILDDYLRKTPGSARWAARAAAAMPDGVTADTRLFKPHGLYIRDAQGVHKTDVDGNRLLDFFGGHGALLLGHGHPRVNAAIAAALPHGVQYAFGHPLEVKWAERIVAHVPNAEQVRFVGSGTEATMLALRIARAATGRTKIVRIAAHYHGWHDFAASGYNGQFDGSPAPGVLPEVAQHTLLVPPDDFATLSATFAAHGDDIAALIVEPVGTHFGVIPLADDFLRACQHQAHAHGAFFVLDEVLSGFRVGPGGMQDLLGLQPDLTTMGKVAAGGMPGGLVCGRADAMAVLRAESPRKVLHQGTFTGNPLTAAAAIATIDEVVEQGVSEHVDRLGALAREALADLFARHAKRGTVQWEVRGRFSACHVAPATNEGSAARLAQLRMGLILEGVDIGGRGSVYFSSQHTAGHVDQLASALSRVLERIDREA